MPFPIFSREKFHKSKHEKNASYSVTLLFFLSAYGTTDISVYKCKITSRVKRSSLCIAIGGFRSILFCFFILLLWFTVVMTGF